MWLISYPVRFWTWTSMTSWPTAKTQSSSTGTTLRCPSTTPTASLFSIDNPLKCTTYKKRLKRLTPRHARLCLIRERSAVQQCTLKRPISSASTQSPTNSLLALSRPKPILRSSRQRRGKARTRKCSTTSSSTSTWTTAASMSNLKWKLSRNQRREAPTKLKRNRLKLQNNCHLTVKKTGKKRTSPISRL